MNFYSEVSIYTLNEELSQMLENIRAAKNFNPATYIEQKVSKLNQYMKESNLKTCVVAISGGIDSALVFALTHEAKKQPGSPIEQIVPIFLPVYKSGGATNQEEAYQKANELVKTFSNDEVIEIDISPAHNLLKGIVDQAIGTKGEDWASGQLVSYLRTPTYYYVTSIMSQLGKPAIVVGTTNKSEGAYLGYFGKASDGMVDIQLINDLYKSEVYEVAQHLGVPQSILDATPTGDMYDNRSDEQVFGAPYEFVELYMEYLNLAPSGQANFVSRLSEEGKHAFDVLAKNLNDLHQYNKHKYLGCSPAVHLDVIDSKIQGGWQYNTY